MFTGLTREELAAGLDAVAAAVLEEARIAGPPVDVFAVAARLGIAVATDDHQQGRARYVRLGHARPLQPRATVLLAPEPRPERRHWALAHEIGEHVAHRAFARLGIDPREVAPRAREQVANSLAGRLLVPGGWLAADGADCDWDLLELKARYGTASHELLARRMLECRPPVIISIFDQGRLGFRRSNVPGRVPPLGPAEAECWQTVHRLGVSQRASEGTRTISGWPVHEPQWKREILRSEVEEYFDE